MTTEPTRSMTNTAVTAAQPVPMILYCPACGWRHLDAGEFATKAHHTHACQHCGMAWRPAIVATVGVQFLPGFKDSESNIAVPSIDARRLREFAEHCKLFAQSLGGPEPQVPSMAHGSAFEQRALDEHERRLAQHWTLFNFGAAVHELYRLASEVLSQRIIAPEVKEERQKGAEEIAGTLDVHELERRLRAERKADPSSCSTIGANARNLLLSLVAESRPTPAAPEARKDRCATCGSEIVLIEQTTPAPYWAHRNYAPHVPTPVAAPEPELETLRTLIKERYAQTPLGSGTVGGSFGEILCHELHMGDDPAPAGLHFGLLAKKWDVSLHTLGLLIADHCDKLPDPVAEPETAPKYKHEIVLNLDPNLCAWCGRSRKELNGPCEARARILRERDAEPETAPETCVECRVTPRPAFSPEDLERVGWRLQLSPTNGWIGPCCNEPHEDELRLSELNMVIDAPVEPDATKQPTCITCGSADSEDHFQRWGHNFVTVRPDHSPAKQSGPVDTLTAGWADARLPELTARFGHPLNDDCEYASNCIVGALLNASAELARVTAGGDRRVALMNEAFGELERRLADERKESSRAWGRVNSLEATNAMMGGRIASAEKAEKERDDAFFRNMLVMLSGHKMATPEGGYGSHGDGFGHIQSDVDRAIRELTEEVQRYRTSATEEREHVTAILQHIEKQSGEPIWQAVIRTITELRANLDDVRDTSFCTKCGWSGVPKFSMPGGFPLRISYWCGREGCGYAVPEPKSAVIDRMTKALLAMWWLCDGSRADHAQRLCECDARDAILRACGVAVPDERNSPPDARDSAVAAVVKPEVQQHG